MTRRLLFAATLLVPAAFAQTPLSCSNVRYCEMREQTVSATGRFSVEDLHNGSVTVRGSNRNDVLVRMRVESDAHSDAEAKDLFKRIHTHPSPGRFTADGPSSTWFFETSWSVSVEVLVPNKTDIVLATHNGAIRANDIQGRVQADSHNGAIRLDNITGDVRFESHNGAVNLMRIGGGVDGSSHNGGVEVELTGNGSSARRVQIESHNGGVNLAVPTSYNAHVVTDSHNGRLNSDFPITVRGRIARDGNDANREFDLGSGGSNSIRIATRNGGIRLRRI
ncbi:MAG: DUF4097 family beta strand repeat-containing protein [Bryobacteraceae bacterium]